MVNEGGICGFIFGSNAAILVSITGYYFGGASLLDITLACIKSLSLLMMIDVYLFRKYSHETNCFNSGSEGSLDKK